MVGYIVDKNFHARFMAVKKTYKYIINCGEYNPLERNYVFQYNKVLNVDKMKEAILYFKGVHNFKNFVSEDAIKESYVREIFDVDISICKEKIVFTLPYDSKIDFAFGDDKSQFAHV